MSTKEQYREILWGGSGYYGDYDHGNKITTYLVMTDEEFANSDRPYFDLDAMARRMVVGTPYHLSEPPAGVEVA